MKINEESLKNLTKLLGILFNVTSCRRNIPTPDDIYYHIDEDDIFRTFTISYIKTNELNTRILEYIIEFDSDVKYYYFSEYDSINKSTGKYGVQVAPTDDEVEQALLWLNFETDFIQQDIVDENLKDVIKCKSV